VKCISPYYTEEFEPVQCEYCLSKNITSRVVDEIAGSVCEEEFICGDCHSVIGYWAYGFFDPEFVIDYDFLSA
jgi:hypothetical protein